MGVIEINFITVVAYFIKACVLLSFVYALYLIILSKYFDKCFKKGWKCRVYFGNEYKYGTIINRESHTSIVLVEGCLIIVSNSRICRA